MRCSSTSILIFFYLAFSNALPRVELPLNDKSTGSVASPPSATDLTPILLTTKATWKANTSNLARRESWENVVSLYPSSGLFAHLEGFLNVKLTTLNKHAVEVHSLQYPPRAISRPSQHLAARTWIRIPMGPRQILDLWTKFRWSRQLFVGCGDFYYQWSLQCRPPLARYID